MPHEVHFIGWDDLIRSKRQSARNAFIVSMTVFVIAMFIAGLMKDFSVYAYAFIVLFILQILTFSFSLKYYDR